jgi:hypothetical protein
MIFKSIKIKWLRPGLNLRPWVPEASMLTTRPPKLSYVTCNNWYEFWLCVSAKIRIIKSIPDNHLSPHHLHITHFKITYLLHTFIYKSMLSCLHSLKCLYCWPFLCGVTHIWLSNEHQIFLQKHVYSQTSFFAAGGYTRSGKNIHSCRFLINCDWFHGYSKIISYCIILTFNQQY